MSNREPLRINEIDIDGFVDQLIKLGIRSSKGKIQPLHQKQNEIIADTGRFKVIPAGRRSGKTLLMAIVAAAACTYLNDRVIWVVAKDYGLTERVFREIYRILIDQLFPKILRSEELKKLDNPTEIYIS